MRVFERPDRPWPGRMHNVSRQFGVIPTDSSAAQELPEKIAGGGVSMLLMEA